MADGYVCKECDKPSKPHTCFLTVPHGAKAPKACPYSGYATPAWKYQD